jgi:hypothetical protein
LSSDNKFSVDTTLQEKIRDLKTSKIKYTNTVDFIPIKLKDDSISIELNDDGTIKQLQLFYINE